MNIDRGGTHNGSTLKQTKGVSPGERTDSLARLENEVPSNQQELQMCGAPQVNLRCVMETGGSQIYTTYELSNSTYPRFWNIQEQDSGAGPGGRATPRGTLGTWGWRGLLQISVVAVVTQWCHLPKFEGTEVKRGEHYANTTLI